MSVTSTRTNDAGVVQRAVGRYIDTGTAAAFTITCGFKPRYIVVSNVDSRDQLEFFEGMANASAVKMIAAGTRTLITTLGLTPTSNGFTVGLDVDVNVTSQQISWLAIG